ncbi:MAG: peptide-methionine (S)-S-oxide reductase MsrA [Polaromonas sp.]|nr:peptide-methionine (S)-S-oxide reductase MsrA [Polaromonas sp.]
MSNAPPDAALPSPQSPGRRGAKLLLVLAVVAVAALVYLAHHSGEAATRLPPPAQDTAANPAGAAQTAVFAGGCFWGVQAVFQQTRGVLNAVSGYAGGTRESAHYASVASGHTGHAESVQVTFDPGQISYGKLLQVFFSVAHDPTELNRQGPDYGTQYRSAVFYQEMQQKEVAERYLAQLDAAGVFPRKIATRLEPLAAWPFYPAEAHHQDYATRNPHDAYIATYDRPKIANLKRMLPVVYRASPALVAQQAGERPARTAEAPP